MPDDPDIPAAFDVYTVVVLRRPDDAPEMSDEELDALQARHLAYRAELRRQGVVVANGPFGEGSRSDSRADEQSDPTYRGMSPTRAQLRPRCGREGSAPVGRDLGA